MPGALPFSGFFVVVVMVFGGQIVFQMSKFGKLAPGIMPTLIKGKTAEILYVQERMAGLLMRSSYPSFWERRPPYGTAPLVGLVLNQHMHFGWSGVVWLGPSHRWSELPLAGMLLCGASDRRLLVPSTFGLHFVATRIGFVASVFGFLA